jgi:hypothetical protein
MYSQINWTRAKRDGYVQTEHFDTECGFISVNLTPSFLLSHKNTQPSHFWHAVFVTDGQFRDKSGFAVSVDNARAAAIDAYECMAGYATITP